MWEQDKSPLTKMMKSKKEKKKKCYTAAGVFA
jgi:hypothetical protein